MDVGYYTLLSQATGVHIASAHCILEGQRDRIYEVSAKVWNVDDPADRNNFRSLHAKTFSTPEPFEFQPHHADEVCLFILQSNLIKWIALGPAYEYPLFRVLYFTLCLSGTRQIISI